MTAWVSDGSSGALVRVRLTTRAQKDEVVGVKGDQLAVRVTTPPVDGRANAAACRALAKRLGRPKTSVEVVRGLRSREKTFEVSGMTAAEVVSALAS